MGEVVVTNEAYIVQLMVKFNDEQSVAIPMGLFADEDEAKRFVTARNNVLRVVPGLDRLVEALQICQIGHRSQKVDFHGGALPERSRILHS